jgi:predicted DNA-binding WGR domain protein
MNNKEEQTRLGYNYGGSDKVYNVELKEDIQTGDWIVDFEYGRRGNSLVSGTKTKDPVGYYKAKSLYDTLIRSKVKKGYDVLNTEELREVSIKRLIEKAANLCLDGIISSDKYRTLRSLLNSDEENIKLAEKIIETMRLKEVA